MFKGAGACLVVLAALVTLSFGLQGFYDSCFLVDSAMDYRIYWRLNEYLSHDMLVELTAPLKLQRGFVHFFNPHFFLTLDPALLCFLANISFLNLLLMT